MSNVYSSRFDYRYNWQCNPSFKKSPTQFSLQPLSLSPSQPAVVVQPLQPDIQVLRSFYIYIHLYIYLYIYLSIHLSIFLSLSLSSRYLTLSYLHMPVFLYISYFIYTSLSPIPLFSLPTYYLRIFFPKKAPVFLNNLRYSLMIMRQIK